MVALLALASAVAYGASDFLAGVAARRVPVLRATTVTYLVGTLALAAVTFVLPYQVTATGVWAGVAAGVAATVGLLTFYAVLASGPMGIASPAIAVLQAGVPVVVGVGLGERLSGPAWAGIVLALVATGLLGSTSAEEGAGVEGAGVEGAGVEGAGVGRTRVEGARVGGTGPGASPWSVRTAVLVVVSGVMLGLSVVALHQAPEGSGLVPAWVDLVVGLVLLVGFEALVVRWAHARRLARVLDGGAERHRGTRLPRAAVAAGVLMAAAQGMLALALQAGDLAVVAALLATYPLATVVLARVVLGERVGPRGVVGIAAAIVAAVLLAVG